MSRKHRDLVKEALAAIAKVGNDKSVDKETVIESLEELNTEIEDRITALEDDEESEEDDEESEEDDEESEEDDE